MPQESGGSLNWLRRTFRPSQEQQNALSRWAEAVPFFPKNMICPLPAYREVGVRNL